jgi:hypothetical protein
MFLFCQIQMRSCIFHNGLSKLKLILRTLIVNNVNVVKSNKVILRILNVNNVNDVKSNKVGDKAKPRKQKQAGKRIVRMYINLIN